MSARRDRSSERSRLRMDAYSPERSRSTARENYRELDTVIKKARRDRDGNQSIYWTKKVLEAEEKDPDRWHHTGFKELYVEDSAEKHDTIKKSRSPVNNYRSDQSISLSRRQKSHSSEKSVSPKRVRSTSYTRSNRQSPYRNGKSPVPNNSDSSDKTKSPSRSSRRETNSSKSQSYHGNERNGVSRVHSRSPVNHTGLNNNRESRIPPLINRDKRSQHRRSRSPVRNARSPVRNVRSPVCNTRSPIRNARSPVCNTRSPIRNARSPNRNARSPIRNARSPIRNARSPIRNARSPIRTARSPIRNARSPNRNARSLIRNARSPIRNARSPIRNARSPIRNARSPIRNARSPIRNARSPIRNARSPIRTARSPIRTARSPNRTARSPNRNARSPIRARRSPIRARRSPIRTRRSPVRNERLALMRNKSPIHTARSQIRRSRSPFQRTRSPLERNRLSGHRFRSSNTRSVSGERRIKSPLYYTRSPASGKKILENTKTRYGSPVRDFSPTYRRSRTPIRYRLISRSPTAVSGKKRRFHSDSPEISTYVSKRDMRQVIADRMATKKEPRAISKEPSSSSSVCSDQNCQICLADAKQASSSATLKPNASTTVSSSSKQSYHQSIDKKLTKIRASAASQLKSSAITILSDHDSSPLTEPKSTYSVQTRRIPLTQSKSIALSDSPIILPSTPPLQQPPPVCRRTRSPILSTEIQRLESRKQRSPFQSVERQKQPHSSPLPRLSSRRHFRSRSVSTPSIILHPDKSHKKKKSKKREKKKSKKLPVGTVPLQRIKIELSSEDSDDSPDKQKKGKLTLSERFSKMAMLNAFKDPESRTYVHVKEGTRHHIDGHEIPPPLKVPVPSGIRLPYPPERPPLLFDGGALDEVRARYNQYKEQGLLQDLSFKDYIKWEEWWYKYQDFLEEERTLERLSVDGLTSKENDNL